MRKIANRRLQCERKKSRDAKRLYKDIPTKDIEVRFLAEYGYSAVDGEKGHYGRGEDVKIADQQRYSGIVHFILCYIRWRKEATQGKKTPRRPYQYPIILILEEVRSHLLPN
ncbi:hypothetical protein R83H12_02702 [Fibrobacteria bacterium R8-3-H12]